jgi:uncharacterized protein YndB with AHSA1/START domain
VNHCWVLLGLSALANGALASDSRVLALAQGKQDTGRTIKLEKTVSCAPARTYAMWATDEGVRTFFAPASRIGRDAGDEYTILFAPAADPEGLSHGTKGARILVAAPSKLLAFEWIVFAGDATLGRNAPPVAPMAMRNETPLPTWVEIAFEPADQGTHIVFRHYGFRDGELWAASQSWFTRAWGHVLDGLAAACAREKLASR